MRIMWTGHMSGSHSCIIEFLPIGSCVTVKNLLQPGQQIKATAFIFVQNKA